MNTLKWLDFQTLVKSLVANTFRRSSDLAGPQGLLGAKRKGKTLLLVAGLQL
jgi:hypothetical protein